MKRDQGNALLVVGPAQRAVPREIDVLVDQDHVRVQIPSLAADLRDESNVARLQDTGHLEWRRKGEREAQDTKGTRIFGNEGARR